MSDSSDGLIKQQRLTHVLDFGYCASEIEGFGEHNLEDLNRISISNKDHLVKSISRKGEKTAHLLHINTMTGRTKDQTRFHSFGKSFRLQ